jgi:uncharacterized protein (DUF1800 family)
MRIAASVTATPAEVSFLWRRAGFGIAADGADDRAGTPWEALVAELIDPEPAPMPAVPATTDRRLSEADRIRALTGAWIDHMASTPTPGAERLTWFWHNHFATSALKVPLAAALLRQLGLLRSLGTGPFRDLLGAVVVDAAMVLYLDNHRNRAGALNENLGRELLELFTVGPGQARQADVVGAARALTGYGADPATGDAWFDPAAHDPGATTVLGVRGEFDAPGLFDLLTTGSRQRPLARHVAGRLWRHWAHEHPTAALLDQLAAAAIAGGLTGRAFARAVLLHPEFRTDATRQALVRTPLEVVVAMANVVGAPPSTLGAVDTLRHGGHCPYLPPHVGGWPPASALRNPAVWWAEAAFALRAMRWMLDQGGGPYEELAALEPMAATAAAFRHAGIVDPSLASSLSVSEVLGRRRHTATWGFLLTAFLGTVLSPDFVGST